MDEATIRSLTSSELTHLIELPEDVDGLRHYIPKAEKLELALAEHYPVRPERQAEILDSARKRQEEHHRNLRTRRTAGPLDRGAQIEAKMGDETWRYEGHAKQGLPWRDEVIGRKASIAYTLLGITTGKRIRVIRSTVEHAHAHLRPIQNWPPKPGRKSLAGREASAAGVATFASVPRRN